MSETVDQRLIRLSAKGWSPIWLAGVLDMPVHEVVARLRELGGVA